MPIEHMEFILPNNDFVVYEVKFQILQMDNISQVVEKRFQSCSFFLLLQHYKTRGRVFSNKGGMIESSQGYMEYYEFGEKIKGSQLQLAISGDLRMKLTIRYLMQVGRIY